jgi:hypothetical protein
MSYAVQKNSIHLESKKCHTTTLCRFSHTILVFQLHVVILRRAHLLESRKSSFSLSHRQARTEVLTPDLDDGNAVAVIAAGGSADGRISLLVLEVEVEVDPLLLIGTVF